METLPLIAILSLFLTGGEPSAPADREARAVSDGVPHAAIIILCLADEFSSADGVVGMLGEEEDSDDRDLSDTGYFDVFRLVAPKLMAVHADVQPRNCTADSSPNPLRC